MASFKLRISPKMCISSMLVPTTANDPFRSAEYVQCSRARMETLIDFYY